MSTAAIKEALKKAAVQIRDEKVSGANTALRVGSLLLAIVESLSTVDINELSEYFLRKDQPDTAAELITFLKGLALGTNGSGLSVLADGTSQAVVDRLYVRIKAYFDALEVKKKTYVGGEQIITPAGMKCVRVEQMSTAYRCYFKASEDGVEIDNTFTVGQLAICQECNIKVGVAQHVGNRFYWREVVGVGSDYIDLSIASCAADSDVPTAGDDIVGLGHIDDIVRQSAIVLSSVGASSPSIIFYQGIDSFSLDGKEVIALEYDRTTGHAKVNIYGETYIGNREHSTYIEYTQEKGVDIKGSFHIEKGSTGWRNLDGLPEEIQKAIQVSEEGINNLEYGKNNLLRNSGFMGDYLTAPLNGSTSLKVTSKMFSPSLKYWEGVKVTAQESDVSESGKEISILSGGSLQQTLFCKIIANEKYIYSFRGKGGSVIFSVGGYSKTIVMTDEWAQYVDRFTALSEGSMFSINVSGDCTLCDLQLERGTVKSAWGLSLYDNDKAFAEIQAINYLKDAIVNGSTDILGGLILSSMIKLGNYKDGELKQENAGMSGIYNNDDDVAFWGGGSFEQAIRTVMRFKDNPRYQPSEEEWSSLANFVVSHGGDVFMRGYIYALGGLFRGNIDIEKNGYRIKIGEQSNETPTILMYDKNGVELLSVYFHDLGTERIPYITLTSPDNKESTTVSHYGLSVLKQFENDFRMTEIRAGYMRITDGEKVLWGIDELPNN